MSDDQGRRTCTIQIQSCWEDCFSCLRKNHAVHPVDTITPEFSEFVEINSKIRLRCIHILPDSLRKSKVLNFYNEQGRSNRSSLSEEYWFSKWNKPYKPQRVGSCNCSFRKSLRLSTLSSQDMIIIDKPPVARAALQEKIDPRQTNLEIYVERLLKNTILDAFQEYYMMESLKKNQTGFVNLAFTLNEDSTQQEEQTQRIETENSYNVAFKLEHSKKEKISTQKDEAEVNNTADFRRCRHNEKIKKPMIFLFHGIGTSADIWWVVIKSLVNSGYEVVAPDMLGHGYSSAPDKKEFYAFQNLLLHALTIFDNYANSAENRKYILIGHSYGCSLVTALYHHRASFISKMILISGGGPTPLAPPVKEDELTHSECFQALIEPLICCGVNRSIFYPPRGKFFDICEGYEGAPSHILKFIRMGQSWPGGDAAFHRRIFVPTLLVHGLLDKLVTLVQECEMERTIPRSFLELIPTAGHMPMIETPDQLTHMILCFFDCWP